LKKDATAKRDLKLFPDEGISPVEHLSAAASKGIRTPPQKKSSQPETAASVYQKI